jgi:hypothetical protein
MFKYIFFLLILLTNFAFAQLYQGPADGSVPSGVIVSTENFLDYTDNIISKMPRRPVRNLIPIQNSPGYFNNIPPTGPEGSNFINIEGKESVLQNQDPLILNNFTGLLDPGGYIPPDQYIAVGPQHVMAVDNGRFRIWDKAGNLIKTINADSWFASALTGASVFDPKVEYDHFNKRWIMVWLDQNDPPNQRGYFLISVSDDSIPIGTWYNWAISNTLNGSSESGLWSDYEGVGFDNQALYITGRQFQFGGYLQYGKIRTIDKTYLYANTGGQLNWKDIWDIRNPSVLSSRPDGIRPSIIYGTPGEAYFMTIPSSSATYLILYKLTNPTGSLSMTGVTVPVTAFSSPPNANQLGGQLIEAGGSALRQEPIYRNGFIWVTHSVAFTGGYSGVNYVKINVSTNTAVEDYTVGSSGHYFFYPAIGVDQDMNLLFNFSRSGDNEYAGAFYMSRRNSDPPGTFTSVTPLQIGKAHYFKDFSTGRNRWGDYNGSWLDPSDPFNFWTITEYAETPANTWACRVGNIRLVPFPGAKILSSSDSLYLGVIEELHSSDTTDLLLYNYGSDNLVISNMQFSGNQFHFAPAPSLPITLEFRDTTVVKFIFIPTVSGNIKDTLRITSNDNTNPVKKVIFAGKGYSITPSTPDEIYGVTGTQEGGTFININSSNGSGTTIGSTGYPQITGISIKPSNGEVYGTAPYSTATQLVRINVSQGDAYPVAYIPVSSVRALAFDLNNDLYIAGTNGSLYKFDLNSGDTTFIGNTGISNLYGLAVNPLNRQLWGVSVLQSVYKINKQNGNATQVGNTGFSFTSDLVFDTHGKLYAVNGVGSQVSNLLVIDTSSGTGTLIGSVNKKGVNGIAISPNPIGVKNISSTIPDRFELYQNYPNPFNPVTKIKFDVPKQSLVTIKVYDVIGREVLTLINQKLKAGSYEINWNAVELPSGVYFFRIKAQDFTDTKKMVLIK